MVVWTDISDYAESGVDSYFLVGQLFNSADEKVGEQFTVSQSPSDDARISVLADGRFVVGWEQEVKAIEDWLDTGDFDTAAESDNVNFRIFDPRGEAVLLNGGDGEDYLAGTRFNDVLAGGLGDDHLHGAGRADHLLGGSGDDILQGDHGKDTLDGGTGEDTMAGGRGNDTYHVDQAGDTVIEFAGEGIDRVFVTMPLDAIGDPVSALDLTLADLREFEAGDAYVLHPYIEHLTLTGSENISGVGNDGANIIRGNSGNNILWGGLDLGKGDDKLLGRAGDDILIGGLGRDLLKGGEGADTAAYITGNDATVDLRKKGWQQTGEGKDKLKSIENLAGGTGTDTFIGNKFANQLSGGDGDDLLKGRRGNDILQGDGDNDELRGGKGRDFLEGGAGADLLRGGRHSDILRGGKNDDELFGGRGHDILKGGSGNDTLTGGTGADIFRIELENNDADTITDFQAGTDRIDLSRIDADTVTDGDQAFAFIGDANFTGTGIAQVRAHQFIDNQQFYPDVVYVYGDVDGNGSVDFTIILDGRHDLTADDFIL